MPDPRGGLVGGVTPPTPIQPPPALML